jgi:hypothetical protein
MEFRLKLCWRSSVSLTPGNSSSLITTVQILPAIQSETEDGINKACKADKRHGPLPKMDYSTLNKFRD